MPVMMLTRDERLAVADYIFSVMRRRGTPKAWLARKLGVSRNAVLRYERGDALPDWVIPRACEILEIPLPTLPAGYRLIAQRDTATRQEVTHGGGTSERDKPNDDTTPRRGRRTA